MTASGAKIITIKDRQAGSLSETVLDVHNPLQEMSQFLSERSMKAGRGANRHWEAFVASPDAQNMLRDGIKLLAFVTFGNQGRSFAPFTSIMTSERPQEEYLRDATLGTLPSVPSGMAAPMLLSGFDGGVTIRNDRYAGGIEVTGDDIRFDRIGKISQMATELGRAGRTTEEAAVYAAISTTANFVRNSTTGDNDVGANTQTLTFSALGLETAMAIISTAKDRKSGNYLGLKADTIICTPRLEWAVKQLLLSPTIARASANNTAEVRGTGETNIYQGQINTIVVTPWLGSSYQWALTDSTRTSFIFQEVEPFNILQEAQGPQTSSWVISELLHYVATGYFGIGFADDRPWFFSDSTTAPTVS